MNKGLLYYLCYGQAQTLRATRRAVEAWLDDIDVITYPADIQEWMRRCGKVRDEIISLHQQVTRLALADTEGRLPHTAAAFFAAAEATFDLFAAVSNAIQQGKRLGGTPDNVAAFDRAAQEVTQMRDRFAAQYPEASVSEIGAEWSADPATSPVTSVRSARETTSELHLGPVPAALKKPAALAPRRP